MGEDEGMGFGTLTGIVFIMIVLLILAFTNKELLGESKEVFEDTFDTQEAIDIFKDTLKDEQDRVLIELENIANTFEDAFNKEGSDCIVKIDTSSFGDDVIVEFKEDKVMRVLKENFVEKIARKNLNNKVYVKGEDNFVLKEFRQVELNGVNNHITANVGQLILYKDINGNFIFPTDNLLITFNDIISCDSSVEADKLAERSRRGEISQIAYLSSLMELYFNEGLEKEALDTYYIIQIGIARNNFAFESQEQRIRLQGMWDNIVNNIDGDYWYLCKDRNNVFNCFDLSVQVFQETGIGSEIPVPLQGGVIDSAIRQSCTLGVSEPIDRNLWYGNLRDCELYRLIKGVQEAN